MKEITYIFITAKPQLYGPQSRFQAVMWNDIRYMLDNTQIYRIFIWFLKQIFDSWKLEFLHVFEMDI